MRGALKAAFAAAGLVLAGAGWVMAQDAGQSPLSPELPSSASPSAAPTQPPAAANSTGDGVLAASAPPDEAAPPAAAAAAPAPVQEAQTLESPPEPAAPPAPLPRPRFATAVLQATDKVTAETLRFEARVGERVRYKGLVITPRACEQTAADEARADAWGYLEVTSQPAPVPGRAQPPAREVFHGWMSANAPALNPLPSPGYDVWVIACRTAEPAAPSGHA